MIDFSSLPIVQNQNSATSGQITLWTPASGNRFRLFVIELEIPAQTAISGGAAELLISLQDGAGNIAGMDWNCYIPATGGTSGVIYETSSDLRPNGYVSTAVGNALKVTLNQTLTAGKVRVRVRGVEHP